MAFSFKRILKGISIFGSSDRTKKLDIEVNEGSTTTNTTTTLRAQQSANRTIVLPDASDTLVGKATTDTLTNKTIDGDDNTVQDLALASLKTNITDANKFLERDGSGIVISSNKAVPSGAVVGSSDSQTLTNKTIDADQNTISNIENADIKAGANIARSKLAAGTANHVVINDGSGNFSSEAQLAKVRGGTGADNSSVTFPGSGVIVTEAATQTLTGKTIDGDDNTVQDLPLTSLKTNITDASKFIVRDASGIPVSNTKDVPSGVVVGTTDTQTLSAKTLTSAIISEGADFIEDDSISSPSSGRRRLQLKTDGKLYLRDSSGNEVAIGSGSGSGINYINNPDAEANADGYATYADAAGASPVDGTGGSPNVTWARSTSSPLRDLANFLFTKDAANRQGEGASYNFSIDPADRGKVLQGSFDYAIGSGTFADDDVSVWIYDVSNAVLIQPAPYKLKNHSLPSERFSFEFQTAIDSTSYRLIFHVASTSASAYTIKVDNISVGPQAKLYGSPISGPVSVTFTGTWVTNTTYTATETRLGKWALYDVTIATSGAPTSANLKLTMPTGRSIDTAALAGWVTNENAVSLNGVVIDSASALYQPVSAVVESSTIITLGTEQSSGTYGQFQNITQVAPITFGAGDRISIKFMVPILGWGDSVVMSTDANVRPTGARVFLSADQTGVNPNGSAVKINLDSTASSGLGFDTHSAWSSNRYNVQVPGKYAIRSVLSFLGTNSLASSYQAAIYKNGSIAAYGDALIVKTAGDYFSRSVSTTLDLIAGDYIEFFIFGAGDNSVSTLTADGLAGGNATYADIMLQSGPAQIVASETIDSRYFTNDGDSYANSGVNIVDFEEKSWDSHNSVTIGASWKFTAPISGKYHISSAILFQSAAWSVGNRALLYVFKNGSEEALLQRVSIQASVTDSFGVNGAVTVKMLAGEYIDIRLDQNRTGGSILLSTVSSNNYISVERVGNY